MISEKMVIVLNEQKLKLVKESSGGMLMIDHELGKRVFNPPAKE